MSMGNIIVLLVLSIAIALILRSLYFQHKNHKNCTGNCASCHSGGCHHDWEGILRQIKTDPPK